MKILALIGSYRKNGNTSQAVDLVCEGLRKEAARAGSPLEIETIFLGHLDIGGCRGCRACFDRGEDKCPLRDDLPIVKAKMKQADGILVASSVYVDDVSGITKNWIDRLAHVCHRPEFAGKCAYLLVTVGSTPTSHAMRTLSVALSTWGFHIAGMTGFKTGALMKPEEMNATCAVKAEKIARSFFHDVHEQGWARPSFMSLFTFKIQQRAWQRTGRSPARRDTLDYAYWSGQGWTEPGREFYIPHAASRVKVILARLAGSLIAPFVS
jgi:multimeric flavodoxin WrbA